MIGASSLPVPTPAINDGFAVVFYLRRGLGPILLGYYCEKGKYDKKTLKPFLILLMGCIPKTRRCTATLPKKPL